MSSSLRALGRRRRCSLAKLLHGQVAAIPPSPTDAELVGRPRDVAEGGIIEHRRWRRLVDRRRIACGLLLGALTRLTALRLIISSVRCRTCFETGCSQQDGGNRSHLVPRLALRRAFRARSGGNLYRGADGGRSSDSAGVQRYGRRKLLVEAELRRPRLSSPAVLAVLAGQAG